MQDENAERSLCNTTRVGPKGKLGSMTLTLRQEEDEVYKNRAQRIIRVAARIGMPTIFVIFCLVFFTYAAFCPNQSINKVI